MKKERNAFFQNQTASTYYYPTNSMPVNMPMSQNIGYPMATESSSNFYQGPIIAPVQSGMNDYTSEIESRLAKIERQMNRLDMRISKLENEISNPISSSNDYAPNNMYMV